MALPNALYSTAQVRALDAHAINELGIAGYTLMKRAGEAALRYLRTRWPMAHRIVIVCGRGNNAGDGYVLARFAHAAGLTVTVLSASPAQQLRGDARLAYEDFRASGGAVHAFAPGQLATGEVIVDALLGTGLKGVVQAQLAEVIRAINSSGRPGAARLAGEACLGVGAGLTTVAVAPENVAPIAAGRPELICVALSDEAVLGEVLTRADVIAVGPGLGRSPWARAALHAVLASGKPLVIDADALNLLAESGAPAREDWILTPHPGEAGRLLGLSAQDIQRDRLAALDRLIERFHGTIVLKGAGTLVGALGRTPGVCEQGNPGMATAGTGDVLTGAIARLLAHCHARSE